MSEHRERCVMKPRMGAHAIFRSLVLASLTLAGCDASTHRSAMFDFRKADPNWSAGFADVPVAYDYAVDFVADHRPLPPPLHGNGLYQSGMNISDGLCMWFSRGVPGFDPGVEYAVSFDVGIASDAGADCDVGIAASTYVKAGASSYAPSRTDVLGWWTMNVDKGEQPGDGTQAVTMGDIRNAIPGCPHVDAPWGERQLSSGQREIRVRAASDGTIWFFVLTDSAWEAAYRVYFTYLDVELRRL